MAHEIGRMFWYGDVPWHGLGAKLKQPATLEEALAEGGLDWSVRLVPLQTGEAMPSHVPQRRAVVRDDVTQGRPGRVLGVVHPDFRPLQNREGAALFHRLFDIGERRYHTGGYLRSGEVVWLLARLPDTITIGRDDAVETYLLYTNSHDGSIAIDIRLTTIRVVCRNTLSLALGRNSLPALRLAHRWSPASIEREARSFFAAIRASIDVTQSLFRRLASRPCDDAAFLHFARELLPDPRPPAASPESAAAKAHGKRLLAVAGHRGELARIRREGLAERGLAPDDPTWWGALNVVTGWVDHVREARGDRYANALLGTGHRIKQRALALVSPAAS